MRDRRRCRSGYGLQLRRQRQRRQRLRLDPAAEMRNVTRVAEITRKLYHQATAPAVLTTAVNEIGGHWEVSRCVALMRTPGSAPTAVQEFCGRGVKEGNSAAIKAVMCALQDMASCRSPSSSPTRRRAPELQDVHKGGGGTGNDGGAGVSAEQWRGFRGRAGADAQQAARPGRIRMPWC